MDAINPREIIAMSIRNGGRANSYNKALYAISDLEANGYQIIHCDENHGPTLERAAGQERELEDVLTRIYQWCAAYPIDMFPEPDFKEARKLLAAGGITIDAISASNMRHVVTQIAALIPASIRAMGEKK